MTNFTLSGARLRLDIFGLSFRIEAAGVMTLRLLCVYEGGKKSCIAALQTLPLHSIDRADCCDLTE
jgi:hypothetical protein